MTTIAAKGSARSRVTACTECRQHKLRCDASQSHSNPCSRCRKFKLRCVITTDFKRIKKPTCNELENEIAQLQQQLKEARDVRSAQTSIGPDFRSQSLTSTYEPLASRDSSSIPQQVEIDSKFGVPVTEPILPGSSEPKIFTLASPTLARSLDGTEVESDKIDEIFKIYFEHYAPFWEVVEREWTPNQCYEYSVFLFWAIIAVGARRYGRDPNLLDRLADRVAKLAFSQLSSVSQPIPTIQGLLLLCAWPLPVKYFLRDLSHLFSGAAFQLGIQHGLHVFGVGQDFSRIPLAVDESIVAFRAKLWALCVIICQSTSFSDGLCPSIVLDFSDFDKGRNLSSVLSPDLQFRLKIHKIQISALMTILKDGLMINQTTQSSALHCLIDIYDQQLQDAIPDDLGEMNTFRLVCARLHLRAFHFFADSVDDLRQIKLYLLAKEVIDIAVKLDALKDFALYCPNQALRMVTLAAYCLLKLSRSEIMSTLNFAQLQQSIFSAIQFAKRRSLQNDDLDWKQSVILAQLWSSDKVFKHENGKSDGLWMRMHSRLAFSVVFDCFWWWRSEFGGQSNPYTERREVANDIPPSTSNAKELQENNRRVAAPEIPGLLTSEQDFIASFFDDQVLTDWEWAGGLIMPPETTQPQVPNSPSRLSPFNFA